MHPTSDRGHNLWSFLFWLWLQCSALHQAVKVTSRLAKTPLCDQPTNINWSEWWWYQWVILWPFRVRAVLWPTKHILSERHHASKCIARLVGHSFFLSELFLSLPPNFPVTLSSDHTLYSIYSLPWPHFDWQSIKFFVLLHLIRLSRCESSLRNCWWKQTRKFLVLLALQLLMFPSNLWQQSIVLFMLELCQAAWTNQFNRHCSWQTQKLYQAPHREVSHRHYFYCFSCLIFCQLNPTFFAAYSLSTAIE